jgi:hypothetical protein
MNYWILEAVLIAVQVGAIMTAMRYAPGSLPVLIGALLVSGFINGMVSSRFGAGAVLPKGTAAAIVSAVAGLIPFVLTVRSYGFLNAILAALAAAGITLVAAMFL